MLYAFNKKEKNQEKKERNKRTDLFNHPILCAPLKPLTQTAYTPEKKLI